MTKTIIYTIWIILISCQCLTVYCEQENWELLIVISEGSPLILKDFWNSPGSFNDPNGTRNTISLERTLQYGDYRSSKLDTWAANTPTALKVGAYSSVGRPLWTITLNSNGLPFGLDWLSQSSYLYSWPGNPGYTSVDIDPINSGFMMKDRIYTSNLWFLLETTVNGALILYSRDGNSHPLYTSGYQYGAHGCYGNSGLVLYKMDFMMHLDICATACSPTYSYILLTKMRECYCASKLTTLIQYPAVYCSSVCPGDVTATQLCGDILGAYVSAYGFTSGQVSNYGRSVYSDLPTLSYPGLTIPCTIKISSADLNGGVLYPVHMYNLGVVAPSDLVQYIRYRLHYKPEQCSPFDQQHNMTTYTVNGELMEFEVGLKPNRLNNNFVFGCLWVDFVYINGLTSPKTTDITIGFTSLADLLLTAPYFVVHGQYASQTTDTTPSSSTVDTTTSSTVDGTTGSTVDSTTSSTADGTTGSTVGSTTSSTADGTTGSSVGSTTSSTVDGTTGSTVDSTTSSTADGTTGSTVGSTTSSTADGTTGSSVGSTTSSTIDGITGSSVGSTTSSTVDGITGSSVGSTTSSTVDETTGSTVDSSTSSTVDGTTGSTVGSTTSSTVDGTKGSTVDSTTSSTVDGTIGSTVDSTTSPTEDIVTTASLTDNKASTSFADTTTSTSFADTTISTSIAGTTANTLYADTTTSNYFADTAVSTVLSEPTVSPSFAEITASTTFTDITASTFFAKTTVSTSFAETTASTSFAETTASTSFADTTAGTYFADTTVSTSLSDTTASTSFADTTASTSFADTTASTSFADTTGSASSTSTSATDTTSSTSFADTTAGTYFADTTVSTSLSDTTASTSFADTTVSTSLSDTTASTSFADTTGSTSSTSTSATDTTSNTLPTDTTGNTHQTSPTDCPCDCQKYYEMKRWQSMTPKEREEALKDEIEKIKRQLSVNKADLSSFIRKKISVENKKVSSKYVGGIGIVIFSLIFGGIVFFDFLKMFTLFKCSK